MPTLAEGTNVVTGIVQDRKTLAETMLQQVNGLINQARAAISSSVQQYQALGFTVDVSGIDTTYEPPAIPSADGMAISGAEWDAMFARAQAKQDRVAVARQWEASNEAAAMGHAQLSETQAANLRQANEEADERTNERALASSTEQAKAKREDVIALAGAKTASERVRIEYARLALDKNLEPEKAKRGLELQALELALRNANAELIDLVQTTAQLTNGLFSTSDVGLSWGISSSESFSS